MNTLQEAKMLKKLSEQRKMRLRPGCKTGRHLICIPSIQWHEKLQLSQLNVQRTLLGRVWSSIRFQLFIGKLSILADHSPIAWEKFKYHDLHQGFNWEYPPG